MAIYNDFIEKFTGNDPDLPAGVKDAGERFDVGREIYEVRENLGLSHEEFAEIHGVASAYDAETIEVGNFEENPQEKLGQVLDAIERWKRRKRDEVSGNPYRDLPSGRSLSITTTSLGFRKETKSKKA
ncbi:MAG: hypothetical protein V1792_15540 [Pseudomonadota bacterium]